ncbi:MAG: ABC transporter ATP-binding protein [Clostridium sp.]|nr:ABC transporter ATP-binding protein [Clostridium sp.]
MYLKVRDLVKYYGEDGSRVEVLKGVNCSVEKGQICVLLGPSGSGKSTLLNIIGGIEEVDGGEIIVDGKSISHTSKKVLSTYRRNNLGFVFQFYNLIPNLSVKENIEVCEYLSKAPLDIDDLIKTLGLWEHKDKFPNQLSGGQQQRCAIGRALVKNPGILLCDEPTGALDYKTSKEILELIENINQKYKNTIIIVTHNDAIKNMAHKVLKLRDGKIIKEYENKSIVPAKELEW